MVSRLFGLYHTVYSYCNLDLSPTRSPIEIYKMIACRAIAKVNL